MPDEIETNDTDSTNIINSALLEALKQLSALSEEVVICIRPKGRMHKVKVATSTIGGSAAQAESLLKDGIDSLYT